jgi:hypothetical protein
MFGPMVIVHGTTSRLLSLTVSTSGRGGRKLAWKTERNVGPHAVNYVAGACSD